MISKGQKEVLQALAAVHSHLYIPDSFDRRGRWKGGGLRHSSRRKVCLFIQVPLSNFNGVVGVELSWERELPRRRAQEGGEEER